MAASADVTGNVCRRLGGERAKKRSAHDPNAVDDGARVDGLRSARAHAEGTMKRCGRALYRRYGRAAMCPAGSVVQSLLLPRGKFTAEGAELWATHHNFVAGKVDVTGKYIRLRQRSPEGLERLRTIPFGTGGVKAIVGWRSCS
jgi:hypothetical protein